MLYVGASYGVCVLFLGSQVAAMLPNGGSNVGCHSAATVWSVLLADIYASWWCLWCTSGVHWVAALSTALSRGYHATHLVFLWSVHLYGGAESSEGLAKSPNPFTFPDTVDSKSKINFI